MSEWWTYQLSDFLMFSPRIYWRLVERYNRELWPLQLAALAAGCALLGSIAAQRPGARRIAAFLPAAAWAWTGWGFAWQRYSSINWAAPYLAVAFALEAALLLLAALMDRGEQRSIRALARRAGMVVISCGVLLYPLAGLPFGRPLAQAEVFGLMPDPTALTTLGVLLAFPLRWRAGLAIVPALSLVAGMLTLWTMAQA
jgi:hypothetical protein